MQWGLATIALVPRGGTAHVDRTAWRRTIDWASRTGFKALEISPQWLNLQALPDSELHQFRRDVAEAGLAISGINVNRCLFTRGPQAEQSLARIWRAIEAAAILQTSLVTISLSLRLDTIPRAPLRGCEISNQEREAAAKELKTLTLQAAHSDVGLSLELHDDGILDSPDLCLEMLNRVALPNVGVNPDLGNLVRGNPAADWRAALAALAPAANNWHVKNYRQGKPSPIWDGEIDYGEAMAMMRAAGYSGPVSIESYFGNAIELQERSLTYLKQIAAAQPAATVERGPAA